MSCPYGHTHCGGRGFCGIERWGWRSRRRLIGGGGLRRRRARMTRVPGEKYKPLPNWTRRR